MARTEAERKAANVAATLRYRERHPERYAEYQKKFRARESSRKSMLRHSYDWRARYPLKFQCHTLVQTAVRTGVMARGTCEECGKTRVEAHHDDYLKPLSVRWLCNKHHQAWHKAHGEGANADKPPLVIKASERFIGVRRFGDTWEAEVRIGGKRVWYMSSPDDEEGLARARDRAAIKLQGRSAKLNFSRREYAGKL